MYFPTLIKWTSPLPIVRLLGVIFHFYSNFKRIICRQTVENLIQRHIMWRLIWICSVCLCPTKRTLGLCGLKCVPGNFQCSICMVLFQICIAVFFLQYSQHLLRGTKTISMYFLNIVTLHGAIYVQTKGF